MSEQDITVSDNFQPVPGVKYEDETVEQPQEPVKEPEKAPETTVQPEKTEEPAQPAEKPQESQEQPRDEQGRFKKAKPIAELLSKKHELETALETERKEKAELQAKLESLAAQPKGEADDDIKALAEEYKIDEDLLNRIVNTARKGINPEIPKEVQDFLQERETQKQIEAETVSFNKRVDSLANTLKEDTLKDPSVRQKLMELAYSSETAPDGEPYHQKELAELYFGFIKPEIEPGKTSAESSRGGTQTTTILDFEEISKRDDPKDIEKMDDATFKKYQQWEKERSGNTPLRRI